LCSCHFLILEGIGFFFQIVKKTHISSGKFEYALLLLFSRKDAF
jgi:hypothetical protein